MALAFTQSGIAESAGSQKKIYGTLAFDSSYPTGGEAYTATLFGMSAVKEIVAAPSSGYLFQPDYTNSKIKVYNGSSITMSGNLYVVNTGSDIKGSANTDSENADGASLPTNGSLLYAATAFSGATSPITISTSPDLGRNVGIFITNDSGGALNLYEGATTYTVTGTWRGSAQTETITFTSTAGNKSVANSKFRYKYGSKPFDTVTQVTYDNSPASGLKISVGIGSKVGLYNNLKTPATADVVKITKNAANLSNSGIVDTTNNTVNLGTLSDNDDFQIVYNTAAVSTVPESALSEVDNGVDLSSLSSVFVAVYGV